MSAAGISWSDFTSYVPFLTDGGVAGVWIVCWLKGWIVSSHELNRTTEECNEWRSLCMKEREAHERTREALHLANQRGESTTEALQLVAGVMNAVRTQAGHEALPEASHTQHDGGNREGARRNREVRPSIRGRPDESGTKT